MYHTFIAVDNLAVTNIQRTGSPMETDLRVQWSAPSRVNTAHELSYRATIGPSDVAEKRTTSTTISFPNRTQGTSYTVSVYTSALRDPAHDTSTRVETTNPKTSAPIYTSKCSVRIVQFLQY